MTTQRVEPRPTSLSGDESVDLSFAETSPHGPEGQSQADLYAAGATADSMRTALAIASACLWAGAGSDIKWSLLAGTLAAAHEALRNRSSERLWLLRAWHRSRKPTRSIEPFMDFAKAQQYGAISDDKGSKRLTSRGGMDM